MDNTKTKTDKPANRKYFLLVQIDKVNSEFPDTMELIRERLETKKVMRNEENINKLFSALEFELTRVENLNNPKAETFVNSCREFVESVHNFYVDKTYMTFKQFISLWNIMYSLSLIYK